VSNAEFFKDIFTNYTVVYLKSKV